MKCAFVLLLALCYVQCRKTYAPIDKNANIAFINMEAGGLGGKVQPTVPSKAPIPNPPQPVTPKPVATTPKQAPVVPVPATNPPNQIRPKPVNPSPVANPITTPGPGSVKQLVNFYDSQGKASPIRPYSYSQAVKQG
ncbi:unnamed protein product [Leptosia nina]|uniref:Uncharacterized protein n=1 Tax=Leptosia nina TaxID=320188 RepID=A0AAV1IVF0_9NEOP